MAKRIIITDDLLKYHTKTAENYMLSTIPDEMDIPYHFTTHFLHKMNKLIIQEKRSKLQKNLLLLAKRIAVLAIVFLTISFTITMSLEEYRADFISLVTRSLEKFSTIFIQKDISNSDKILLPIYSDYIPSGFQISEQEINPISQKIYYTNEQGTEIYYEQFLLSTGGILLDTEDVSIEKININSHDMYTFTNKGTNQLYWYDDSYRYSFTSSVSMEELVKMASSIVTKLRD